MSMAEDTRNRVDNSNDSPKGTRDSSDPLAELARLIGQNDPFTDRAAVRKPMGGLKNDDRPAPEWLARPAAREDEYEAPEDHYATPSQGQYAAPQGGHSDQRYDDARHEAAPEQQYAAHDEEYAEQDQYAEQEQDQHAEPHAPGSQPARYAAHADQAIEGADQYADDRYQHDDRYRVVPPSGEYDGDGYYADDGHLPPQSGEGVTGGRRRSGLITIAAVLGLAAVGTAGAFGYRAYTSSSASSGNPPVIKAADSSTLKTVPAPATPSADTQGKPFQDRAGTGAPERVVPREEQPVALPTQRSTPPQAPGQALASPPPGPGAAPAASINEPKRVKTMVIREGAQSALAPPEQTIAPPAAAAPTQPAARAPATKQQSGPMAISPQSDPSSRTKVATRSAAVPSSSYVVQLSSEPSEAEAQSSYRVLQQKYPSILGGREASFAKVDLPKAGTRYRVQLTGFANFEAATTFCNNYKNLGGQCIVNK